jgi:hypothetical protein
VRFEADGFLKAFSLAAPGSGIASSLISSGASLWASLAGLFLLLWIKKWKYEALYWCM